MSRAGIILSPLDAGRRMSLDEFRTADVTTGDRYELSRGVLSVSNVPNRRHHAMLNATRQQFSAFEVRFPGVVASMSGGSDCKIIVEELDSERHPDWAVYKSQMPDVADDEELWSAWVPDLVIEVVSPESADRDYNQKPEEYLRFGIPEYWIIDETPQEMLVLQRSAGRYRRRQIKPGEIYRPNVLKGLEFDLARILDAARAVGI
jgi:hypothetical protein